MGTSRASLATSIALTALAAGAARAETVVPGGALGDATWTAAGSPYHLTGPLTVSAGATLTIEPGVEVVVDYALTVEGTLLAEGTAARPIALTGTSSAPGAWSGLVLQGTRAQPIDGTRLAYVTVTGGGRSGASVVLRYAHATLEHCAILGGAGDGIRGYAGGVADVSDTEVRDHAGYALRFDDGTVVPVLARLTAAGNGVDRVALAGGTVAGVRRLPAVLPYALLGTLVVPADAELVVEPGAQLYFTTGLDVRGTFTARGTAALPILLTADAATPGSWDGISIVGTPSAYADRSALEHVTVEWAGLSLRWARASLAHAVIRGSPGDGVRGSNAVGVDLDDVALLDNAGYPIRLDDPARPSSFSRLTTRGNAAERIALGGGSLPGVRELDAVLPYEVLGALVVPVGARLVLLPGVELRLHFGLTVLGTIDARGTAEAPVVLHGAEARPGAWEGLAIEGTGARRNVGSMLDWVVLEHGGARHANLYVRYASARLTHTIVRGSATSGVLVYRARGTSIEESAFVDNGAADDYAVRNATPDEIIHATLDWWGSATGPDTDDTCHPLGVGARVSAGVVYLPYLESNGEDPGPAPPLGMLDLRVKPERWFVPATGVHEAYVKITLRDAVGAPVVGRKVELSSSRGTATAGGVTDVYGESWATVRSRAPGDAVLLPALGDGALCEPARVATATITFVAGDEDPLMPGAAAPYLSERLDITPHPLIQGHPATARATLKNPGDVDLSVDVDFGYAQLGIGQVFGPIGHVVGAVVPAGGEKAVEVTWTPLFSGHFCVRMTYDAQPYTAGSGLRTRAGGSSGSASKNTSAQPANLTRPEQDDAIDQANEAMHAAHVASVAINGMEVLEHGAPSPFWMPEVLAGFIAKWNLERGREISDAMKGSETVHRPKRPVVRPIVGGLVFDGALYWELPRARNFELPALPVGPDVSAAKAAAYDAWLRTGVEAFSELEAMALAQLRNREASEAGELGWASQQASAFFFFGARAGRALIAFADATDALLAVLAGEGMTTDVIGADAWRAFQANLRGDGFSADEVGAAHFMGFTDAEVEAVRQRWMALDPEAMAGDRLATLAELGAVWRRVGVALSLPPPFMVHPVAGGLTVDGHLARVSPSASAFVLGNPLPGPADVELRVRPIDVPSDWVVTAEPEVVTLGPGETTTVTVTWLPGSSVPQGTTARVAVEGYAEGALLGGVVIDSLVPTYTPVAAACVGRGTQAAGQACACAMDCRVGLVCAAGVCGTVPTPSPTVTPEPEPSDVGCGCASVEPSGAVMVVVLWGLGWLLARGAARRRGGA